MTIDFSVILFRNVTPIESTVLIESSRGRNGFMKLANKKSDPDMLVKPVRTVVAAVLLTY